MPAPDASFMAWEALAAFGIVALAAFAVTWVTTSVADVPRSTYVAILAAVTGALGAGYVAASGVSVSELVTTNVGWALVAGVIAGLVCVPLIRKLPGGSPARGMRRAGLVLWEDVVYGTAEGLLLATLPTVAIWHAASIAGWTGSTIGNIGAGVAAVVGSLVVIVGHHLGYPEFRASRVKMAGAMVTCGVQAIAFLLTGSIVAPIVAHIVLHAEMTFRGTELPPHQRRGIAATA
jgi:hypothetical protein